MAQHHKLKSFKFLMLTAVILLCIQLKTERHSQHQKVVLSAQCEERIIEVLRVLRPQKCSTHSEFHDKEKWVNLFLTDFLAKNQKEVCSLLVLN